jgi:hypothetical protein
MKNHPRHARDSNPIQNPLFSVWLHDSERVCCKQTLHMDVQVCIKLIIMMVDIEIRWIGCPIHAAIQSCIASPILRKTCYDPKVKQSRCPRTFIDTNNNIRFRNLQET